jgi:protein-tyrosine phosphatase
MDFCPPTLETLEVANEFFLQHKSTLVHCGYGHGRTGTGVTALQLYAENGAPDLDLIIGENYVESRGQMEILGQLRDRLRAKCTSILYSIFSSSS